MPEQPLQDPYAPPRSSVVDPRPPETPAEYWPAVIKLLAVCMILECAMHFVIPMVLEGGLAWPDFGKLMVSLAVLFSVLKRNRWGWILYITGMALATPLAVYFLYTEWDRFFEMLGKGYDIIPWYYHLLFVPSAVAFVLLFFPQTIRWYFGKHSQRNKLVTAFIVCLVLTGHAATIYSGLLVTEEEVERARELDRLMKKSQEQGEKIQRLIEEIEEIEKLEGQAELDSDGT